MARHGVFDATRVQLPYWLYISGTTITNPNNQAVVIPSEATIFEIDSEGAECYYAINNPICSTLSDGYVPSEGGRIIGPLSNLTTLRVHGTTAIVHIMFFKEV